MKIFLDTANRDVIKKWMPTGIIDGITTNPSHLSKEGGDIQSVLKDICNMVPGDVSIEVVEKTPDAVYKQAHEIAKFASNVVVKIPFAEIYLPVMKKLISENVRINVTLVFTTLQALLVSKLGVTYLSPFVGRWDEIGVPGTSLLNDIVNLKHTYDFKTEILAASLRTIPHWQEAALAGADIATVPPALLEAATKHPLTERGIEMFDNDWKKLSKTSLFEE